MYHYALEVQHLLKFLILEMMGLEWEEQIERLSIVVLVGFGAVAAAVCCRLCYL